MDVIAFAKLNLALKITGRRPDGYHELDMVMHDALAPFREHATALWALGKLAIHRTH